MITEQFADEGLHFERFEVVDVLASADEDDGTARRSNATNAQHTYHTARALPKQDLQRYDSDSLENVTISATRFLLRLQRFIVKKNLCSKK